MPPLTAKVPGSGAATLSYTIPGDGLDIETVYASIDTTAAGAAVTAEITITDQAGVVIARKAQTTTIPAGTTGTATWALQLDDDSAAAATPTIGPYWGLAGWQSGDWYTSQFLPIGGTGKTNPGDMTLLPIYCPGATIQAVGFIVDIVAVSGQVRIVCYKDNGFGYPGALEFDTGNVGAGTPAGKKTYAISHTLAAGLYWIGHFPSTASISTRTIGSQVQIAASGPTFANVDAGNGFSNYFAGAPGPATPDPFPSGKVPSTTGNPALIWMQAA